MTKYVLSIDGGGVRGLASATFLSELDKSTNKKLSESLDVRGSLILDSAVKTEAVNKIKKKYGAISKLFLRGPDENRAIIQLDELGGE